MQALAQIECRIFKLEFNFDFTAAQSFAQAYLEALRWVQAQAAEHTNFWHIYPLRQFILTIHKQIQPWLCHASPCAAGERLWHFDAEAKLWACTFKHPKLFLGGLAQLQDLDFMVQSSAVIQELTSRRLINLPRCSRCAFRQLCGGGCPARSLNAYGDLLREDPQCYFLQMVFEGLLWLLVQEREGMFYLGGALG